MAHQKFIVCSGLTFICLVANAIILKNGFTLDSNWYWALLVSLPLLIVLQKEGRKNDQASFSKKPLSAKRKR